MPCALCIRCGRQQELRKPVPSTPPPPRPLTFGYKRPMNVDWNILLPAKHTGNQLNRCFAHPETGNRSTHCLLTWQTHFTRRLGHTNKGRATKAIDVTS